MDLFRKPKRRKLDQYLRRQRKDPEVALSEMTQLSNRVWRLLIGLSLSTLFVTLLLPVERWGQLVSLGVLIFLLNGLGWAALTRIHPYLFERPARFNQFIGLMLATVLISKVIFLLEWSPFLVPLPFLAMVLAMNYGQSVALLVSIGMGFYLSLLSPRLWDIDPLNLSAMFADSGLADGTLRVILDPVLARADFVLGISAISGSMTAVILLDRIRQQSYPTLVGSVAGLTQGLVVLAFQLFDPALQWVDFREWGTFDRILVDPGWAIAGGLISGGLLTIFLPAIETLFGIVTERRLLALSDPNNELLYTLRNRAPGTYQHTLGVAQLCSAAAEAIGADPLLIQVGAYYHDIGKLVKPEYFVENMGEDKTIHERLKPSMSKLIIISHVKEGIELATEAKLPQQIIDFIPMHHGTTVVEYFFYKALEGQEATKSKETDSEYRYPGPRPRFPEAGIIILADAVEAIAKTLPEPNPNRFRDIVKIVIQKRLEDGQLDECDLTIKDLRNIEDSFVKTLTNMYHGRIRYPSGEGGSSAEGESEGEDDDTTTRKTGRKKAGKSAAEGEKLVPSAGAASESRETPA